MELDLPMKIIGLGRYLPERIVTNAEVEHLAGLEPGTLDPSIVLIRERRWAGIEETGSWMGAKAAEEALQQAGLCASELDLLIIASATQELGYPHDGPLIQQHLGMSESGVRCFRVHTTCLSFLTGLHMAALHCAHGQCRNILIVSSEISSVGIDPKVPEVFSIFGDCAAAAVVCPTPAGESSKMHNYAMRTFSEGVEAAVIASGTANIPVGSPHAKQDDFLFYTKPMQIIKVVFAHMRETLEAIRSGLSEGLGNIKLVVPHQPSAPGLKVLTRFGIPQEKIMVTFDRLGNCTAASLPATLYEAVKQGRIRRGDEVLLFGAAAGVSLAGAIITY